MKVQRREDPLNNVSVISDLYSRLDSGKKKELKCIMQGWLEKQRRKSNGWLDLREFDLRWFRIQELQGSDQNEFALCYYGGRDEKEARGWIYLRDVTEIYDDIREKERSKGLSDVLSFTVVSIGRSITLHTTQQSETVQWLQTLVENCPQANTIRIMLPITGKRTMGGLLTPAPAKSNVSKSKAENKTSWERPAAEDSDDGNECRRSLTEDGGDGEEEATWFEGLGGSRPRKEITINKSDSFTVPGSLEDTLREQNNNNREKERNRDREDHRKMGTKKAGAGTDSATTSRLHRYISGPGSGRNSANNSDSDGQPISARQNSRDASPRLQQSEMKESSSGPPPTAPTSARRDRDEDFDSDREIEHQSSSNSHSTSIDEEVEHIALTTRRVVNSSRNRAKEIRMQQQQQSKDEATEAKQEEESSSSAAPTRRSKGAPLPPPSSSSIYTAAVAKPRRAKDLDDDDGEAPNRGSSNGRISVDAFLAQQKPQGIVDDTTDDVDIKAELRKYSQSVAQSQGPNDRSSVGVGGSQEISGGRSRPPRAPGPAPVGSRAPYSNITQLSNAAAAANTRNGTPPRRAADPGAKTDANFVNDDWDADSPAVGAPGRGMWKAEDKPTSSAPKEKAGVKEDANWLHEDFDD